MVFFFFPSFEKAAILLKWGGALRLAFTVFYIHINKIVSNALYFPGHSLRMQSITFLGVSYGICPFLQGTEIRLN